jgi:DNA-binding protein H-NS
MNLFTAFKTALSFFRQRWPAEKGRGERTMQGDHVDIERMDETELRELIQRAQKALDGIVSKRARRTLKEVQRMAAEVGFEASFTKTGKADGRKRRQKGEKAPAASVRAKVAAKYRNPDNQEETWTGRGRKPKWVQAALAEGRVLADLAI